MGEASAILLVLLTGTDASAQQQQENHWGQQYGPGHGDGHHGPTSGESAGRP